MTTPGVVELLGHHVKDVPTVELAMAARTRDRGESVPVRVA
jgi:hypothetical protein